MHAVITSQVPAVINALIDGGADVNAPNKDGISPLMMASQTSANPAVAEALIKAGADVNARDQSGKTVLDHTMDKNSAVYRKLKRLQQK